MKILWAYLKPYRWLIGLSLLLAAAAQLLSLIDPIIFGMIIDAGGPRGPPRHGEAPAFARLTPSLRGFSVPVAAELP